MQCPEEQQANSYAKSKRIYLDRVAYIIEGKDTFGNVIDERAVMSNVIDLTNKFMDDNPLEQS